MAQDPKKTMSLESALDEERREVMKILEGRSSTTATSSNRGRTASPAAPIRSMLDISSPAPRGGSTAGAVAGPASPKPAGQTIRSMLDPKSPPPTTIPPPRISHSAVTSPITERPPQDRHRSSSDATRPPAEGLRRIEEKQGVNIAQDYQFGMLPSIQNQALPKRVGQAGKSFLTSSAMSTVMSGDRGRQDTGRHNSTVGIPGKSRSPSSRLPVRSQSPSMLGPAPPVGASSSTYVTDSGKVIDMDKAYRRLSDVAFRKAGSSLAPKRMGSVKSTKSEGAENESPDTNTRLVMDEESGPENAVTESTDEDIVSSDDEEHRLQRGRRRSRKKSSGTSEGEWEDEEPEKAGLETTIGMGRGKGPRTSKSLLAAAEEERLAVASKAKAGAAGEPTISVTTPTGEKMVPKKAGVHPITSFDHTASSYNTEASDTDNDLSDIKRAQRLSINMSHVDNSVPNRAIRTILRGDFTTMEQEAEEGLRRQRLYLVATDLSDEAVYALEWTIGTILRDGDTLFAMYAVDEDTGTGKAGESDSSHHAQTGEGTRAAREAVHTMATLTERAKSNPVPQPSPLVPHGYLPATDAGSRAASLDARSMTRGEAERYHAIDGISQTCVRLLRKTRLQVRVTVEVIHCKSPKHLVTEAIDTLSPTLVILGSRGRSALKGVLLGSFSNYLVTKSSVPVMVARKKLRKHAKYKPTAAGSALRLSNNLLTQKRVKGLGLAGAKID